MEEKVHVPKQKLTIFEKVHTCTTKNQGI